MNNLLKNICLRMLLLASISSCTNNFNKRRILDKECVRLNDQGVQCLMESSSVSPGAQTAKAIKFLKKAIACDSNYTTAYINLFNAYDKANNNNNALLTLNHVLKLTKEEPSILLLKVKLFEKVNAVDSVIKVSKVAEIKFKQILVKQPNNFAAVDGLILLKAITEGKDAALKELSKQIKIHSDLSPQLISEYDFYKSFNKNSFNKGMLVDSSRSQ